MNAYAQAAAGDGENITYSAALSHWAFARSYVSVAAFLVVAAGFVALSPAGVSLYVPALFAAVAALIAAVALLRKRATELTLTDRCIIAKWGVLSRSTAELALSRVESLHVRQSLLGRLLNYGDVTVVGVGSSLEPLHGIKSPLELRRRIATSLHDRGHLHS